MDRARGPAPAIRRAGSLALITAFLGMAGLSLAGCASSSSSPGAGSSQGTASASPGLSVPGTDRPGPGLVVVTCAGAEEGELALSAD